MMKQNNFSGLTNRQYEISNVC